MAADIVAEASRRTFGYVNAITGSGYPYITACLEWQKY